MGARKKLEDIVGTFTPPSLGKASDCMLIYVSRAVGNMTPDVLRKLADRAAAANNQRNITGMLIYASGQFMQVLEGDAVAVVNLYDRIKADPRHTDVERVFFAGIAARCFTSWNMGLLNLSADTAELDRDSIRSIRKAMDIANNMGPGDIATAIAREFQRQTAKAA